MSTLESSLTESAHIPQIDVKQEPKDSQETFWPMMFFKPIIAQKPTSPAKKKWAIAFISITCITILLFLFLQLTERKTPSTNLALQQQLEKVQALYQHQLQINQALQAQVELHSGSIEQSENTEESEILSVSLAPEQEQGQDQFEQALDDSNLHHLDDAQQILLPLTPAVETSLFRMIPNDTPVDYKRVSSPYGERTHPISGKWSRHLGMDLTCPRGTPIFSTADGVVEITRPSNQGYGNMIKIRHAFGFMTLYAHLNQFAVKTGQFVEKGDRIGFCGSSGNSTGSHLHYEVRFIGKTLNPKDFMQWQPSDIAQLFEQQKQVPWTSLIAQLTSTVNQQVLLAMNRKEQIFSKPSKKQAKVANQGLTAFGIEEDGWATVEE
ncbi:M23 family metallopeptidase [Vibrio gangliei]|uniref:M23 family metallopeptidase n=1 Tax=Vibrio gangliei TaxID=2077090 RepID=UPI001FE8F57F|nr:M23 family metallopeptidase [Vibrio gangliei]